MSDLVIVESPAKARTIGRILGDKYLVKFTLGHIRDLPPKELGVNVEKNFLPKYEISTGKKKLVSELKSALQKSDKVYIATDPDREGEAIAWHVKELLSLESPQRIVFHEITKKAIEEAINNPQKISENLFLSQQARRILDRLVGYTLSPFLWRKVKKGLSAGRVQSVTVRLICEREEEINNFVSKEYWSITANLLKLDGNEKIIIAKLQKKNNKKLEIENEQQGKEILNDLQNADYIITDIIKRERLRNPSPPFITSTLQQEANKKFGFSAVKTMIIAQQLYEGVDLGNEGPVGLITYHRTDSTNISVIAKTQAKEFIIKNFGNEYLPDKERVYKVVKGAQEAHEAIRPTSVYHSTDNINQFLSPDQKKLYTLIYNRFLASQMASAVYDEVSVDITAKNYLFKVVGRTLKFAGFLKIYSEEKEENTQKKEDEVNEENGSDSILPPLSIEEKLKLQSLIPKQHFTQPPPRYTEASLVKTLEEKGIGRPSTYAPTIETIKKREYIKKENKYLIPSELGKSVNKILLDNCPNVMDIGFTATMEEHLDDIEEGKYKWDEVIKDFYFPFKENVDTALKTAERVKIQPIATDKVCEICGKPMVIRQGRFGEFLSCSGYPECKNAKSLSKTDIPCPKENCGGTLIKRKGKRGFFYGCSNYPNCKYLSNKLPEKEESTTV